MHPEDRYLLGMEFDGRVYVNTTLPFGLKSAPKLFSALADALEWILKNWGVSWLMHYIDDFLKMGVAGSDECARNLAIFKRLCSRLNLPLKDEKVVGPVTVVDFLGIILDTERMLKGLRKRKPWARDPRMPITPLVLSVIGRALVQFSRGMSSTWYGQHAA